MAIIYLTLPNYTEVGFSKKKLSNDFLNPQSPYAGL